MMSGPRACRLASILGIKAKNTKTCVPVQALSHSYCCIKKKRWRVSLTQTRWTHSTCPRTVAPTSCFGVIVLSAGEMDEWSWAVPLVTQGMFPQSVFTVYTHMCSVCALFPVQTRSVCVLGGGRCPFHQRWCQPSRPQPSAVLNCFCTFVRSLARACLLCFTFLFDKAFYVCFEHPLLTLPKSRRQARNVNSSTLP